MIPKGIVMHHSLTKDGLTADWEGIKRYHTAYRYQGEIISQAKYDFYLSQGDTVGLEKPWSDIGYHAGVERIGGVLTCLTGRPLNMTGAHCQGHNDMIGICIVGNFDLAPPDDELLRYSAIFTAGFARMFSFGPDKIHRHHEYATKSCPGKLFPWPEFIKYVEGAL